MKKSLVSFLVLLIVGELTVMATNCVPNPGFEAGTQSWSLWQTLSGTAFTADVVFKEGAKSAMLIASNSGNQGSLYTYAALSAQKNYRIRFWYKTQNLQFAASGGLALVLNYNKQGGGNGSTGAHFVPINITQPDNDWTLFETAVTTPVDTVKCQFAISLQYGTGTFWVDGVVMDEMPELINLIPNPGFEAGTQSWSLWQTLSGTSFTADMIFKEGVKSAMLTASNSGNQGSLYTYSGTLSAQKNYHVRFWYKTQNLQFATGGGLVFCLYYNKQGGGNGSAGSQAFQINITQPDNDWTLFETEVATPVDTVKCQFAISLQYATGTFWLDGVVMETK
ncbi:MAG: carbohydrate binding domain-containing protein [Victivallaceae bacterium]|jgi:hypothetical protein